MSISPAVRFRLWAVATGGYWCALAVAMHVPLKQEEVTPGWINVPHVDKIVHTCLYAALGFLLTATLAARQTPRAGRVAFGIAAAYGVLDELTQPLTGRHCDVWDYATDLIGIGVGMMFASRWVARP